MSAEPRKESDSAKMDRWARGARSVSLEAKRQATRLEAQLLRANPHYKAI